MKRPKGVTELWIDHITPFDNKRPAMISPLRILFPLIFMLQSYQDFQKSEVSPRRSYNNFWYSDSINARAY